MKGPEPSSPGKNIQVSLEQTGSPGAAAGGYLDHIDNVVQESKKQCPAYYNEGSCDTGHYYVKELLCCHEWCPTCGQDKSKLHLRRFARWLPKAFQCKVMGYFVFTIPEATRAKFRTKEALSFLSKRVTSGDKSKRIVGLLKNFGFDRGFSRWHFFGDKSTKYHPHLNVIVNAGRISHSTLEAIKREWANILGVDKVVVQYSFTRKQAKMVHILKYVTRLTFKDEAWDEQLAFDIKNFRNMRSWGVWKDEPVWEMKGKAKYEHIESLEKGLCPKCGKPIHWGKKALYIGWLKLNKHKKELGAGYYEINTS